MNNFVNNGRFIGKKLQSACFNAYMKNVFNYFCTLINPINMKKVSLFLVLVMSTMLAMAQNGRIDLRSTTRADITHSDFNSLRATFSYGSIESIEVNTERGTFSEIAIEGTYASGEIGTPELPVSHELLAVPFGATPRVTVTSYSTTDYRLADYGIGTLLPHQPSVRKDQRPEDVEFVYNTAAYQATRSLATAPEATIEVQGTMRGIRIGSLVINPVNYNPTTNTLRVFNDIEVEVSFDGADRSETERMLLSTYSPYFNDVYRQMFNYRQILDVYDDHPDLMAYPVHMIVIAPQSYMSALEPWINWKTQKGFYMTVVPKETAGSNYNAIRTYVQNLYNTGVNQGATPTFLVLVGDTGQIPNTTGSSTNKVTDLYYGSVDGDYFPDMFYSRMSAENTSQLTAIINKILQYEQYTMPDPSYLSKVLLIAGADNSWNPRVGQPTINYGTTYYYNTAHGFTNVYAYLNSYSGCYNNLSTGVGFANYTAHGDNNMWYNPQFTNSNVSQLTNTNKYFLAMGNCCLSGNFGYSSSACFGEAMIRAENKGAYSYIGSCPNTYWYEDYYFAVGATTVMNQTPTQANTATGCYDGIWMDDTYHTVSSIVFLGNLAVCYAHAGSYQTSSNPTYYWQAYHVLGDGSIMPYRVVPDPNNVSHTSTFPAGATSFQVSAQEGSYVAISQNNVLKGVALVPASGTVNVQVESGITTGQVRIVVTKPQRQPYIQDINVSSPQNYTITVSANPTNGGTVTGGGTYASGASCTVSATANTGYNFISWTEGGNVVSTNASYTFTVTGNRNLVANFEAIPQNYTITVSANPTNGGTTTGGGTFQEGTSCTVSATANTGYTFSNWTENGNVVSTSASYTFTVTGNRNLVANFTQQTYTVAVSANPTTGGTVTGGGTYTYGQSCTVSATANNGYTFANWTENGNVVSTNASYTFTVTGNRTLVANFTQQTYTITVSANPTNGGTVTGGGAFHYGESCTVMATAANGYSFVNWTENGNAVSTNANYTFTVTGGRTLVANFAQQTYTITATADPANGGTVTGGGTYSYGQTCTLAATAASGYTFINWTKNGQQVSTNTNYSFTVTESAAYVAHFQAQTPSYTIRVSSNPSNGGTVSGGGTYEQGATCTVTATPNQRYVFVNWTENGNVVSTSASYSFVVTANRVLVANFEGEAIDIKVNIEPAESAQVTGEGTYHYGDEVTLTVTPNENYVFQNWTEGGLVVCETPTYTFTATVSRTLTANLLYTEGVGESNCKVTLYPNPVNDKLTVEANETIDKVEIYNLVGALVYSERSCSDKVEITTADLQSGIYFIRLTTKNASETRRFVKE